MFFSSNMGLATILGMLTDTLNNLNLPRTTCNLSSICRVVFETTMTKMIAMYMLIVSGQVLATPWDLFSYKSYRLGTASVSHHISNSFHYK